jgi:hypothetical protein
MCRFCLRFNSCNGLFLYQSCHSRIGIDGWHVCFNTEVVVPQRAVRTALDYPLDRSVKHARRWFFPMMTQLFPPIPLCPTSTRLYPPIQLCPMSTRLYPPIQLCPMSTRLCLTTIQLCPTTTRQDDFEKEKFSCYAMSGPIV